MSSNFVTISPKKMLLADSFTADQVVGNRLKIRKDVTVHLRHPHSGDTETWKSGFLSPPVYSWVQHSDGLYWVIGELKPIRYVKHQKGSMKLIPDHGGAQYLQKNNSDNFLTNPFKDLSKNLKDTIKLITPFIVLGAGIYFGAPIASLLFKRKLVEQGNE